MNDKSDTKGKTKMERRDIPKNSRVMMKNFDPWADFEYQRPEPEGDQVEIQVKKKESQTVKIRGSLPPMLKERMIKSLRRNTNLFAWLSSDMPGVDPNFYSHCLSIRSGRITISLKKR
jgi:hypothetical protein